MSEASTVQQSLSSETEMVVNGNPYPWVDGLTILSLLQRLDLAPETVAVERNREIVRRTEFDRLLLAPNDRLEIVRFVQGG